jgi:cell division protein FtsB
VLVIGFGAIALYSTVALTEENSKVNALQKTAAELQTRNSELESNLSSLNQPQATYTQHRASQHEESSHVPLLG